MIISFLIVLVMVLVFLVLNGFSINSGGLGCGDNICCKVYYWDLFSCELLEEVDYCFEMFLGIIGKIILRLMCFKV